MKSKIQFFLIIGLAILGLVGYGYFKATPGIENQTGSLPKIEISPQLFDFGEVEYGQVAEYTFKVKNAGSAILEIKKVATSCACTTAKIAKEKINPGEEVNLQVVYNTGAMSGPHAKGEQERIIYVKNNDPINPQVEVMITAYVK
ncbi:MAG: DUF1573 domain-containing protein [Candidatus Paceibacterales bacterium]